MGKTEITEVLNFMKELYNVSYDHETMDNWSLMFEEYTKDDVKRAIKRYRKKKKYVPTINEILNELDNEFTVSKEEQPGLLILIVNFKSPSRKPHAFPFVCTEEKTAKTLYELLKLYPSYDEVKEAFMKHLEYIKNKRYEEY